jgi:hypothetical protein
VLVDRYLRQEWRRPLPDRSGFSRVHGQSRLITQSPGTSHRLPFSIAVTLTHPFRRASTLMSRVKCWKRFRLGHSLLKGDHIYLMSKLYTPNYNPKVSNFPRPVLSLLVSSIHLLYRPFIVLALTLFSPLNGQTRIDVLVVIINSRSRIENIIVEIVETFTAVTARPKRCRSPTLALYSPFEFARHAMKRRPTRRT